VDHGEAASAGAAAFGAPVTYQTNHNIMYAYSDNGGIDWRRDSGVLYRRNGEHDIDEGNAVPSCPFVKGQQPPKPNQLRDRAGWHLLHRSHLGSRSGTGQSHGVLAPNAKWRSQIIPSPPEPATEASTDHAHTESAPARMSWARLLQRVFDSAIEHCPNCGGALKIIAAIEDPPGIARILTHLGLPTRAPPRAPAQRFDLFQTT
jgi:hypothetical protein